MLTQPTETTQLFSRGSGITGFVKVFGWGRSLELTNLRPISLLTGKLQGKIADFAEI